MEAVLLTAIGVFALAVVGRKVVSGIEVARAPKTGQLEGGSSSGGSCGSGCGGCGTSESHGA